MRRSRKTVWCVAAALAPLLWGAAWVFGEWRFRADLERARTAITARQFEKARALLTGRMAARADDAEASFLLGVCEQAVGHPAEAAAAYGRIPLASARGWDAARARVRVLIDDLGRFAEAEVVCTAALAHFGPNAAELRYAWTQVLYWEGRLNEMRRLFQREWATSPARVNDLHQLWRIDNAVLMFGRVGDIVERAARRAPDDDRVWLARANLARHAGQLAQARKWLDACLERRPEDPAVWYAWLRLAQEAGTVPEAWQALRHLSADQLSPSEILLLRAWLAGRSGQEATERAALEAVIAAVPGNTQALERLATLEAKSGRAQRSAELRRRKAGADEMKARYFYLVETCKPITRFAELGELAEKLGRGFEARAWWLLAAGRQPGDSLAVATVARLGQPQSEYRGAPGMTLADLVHDSTGSSLAPAEDGTLAGQSKSVSEPGRVPAFRDDAGAAGLRFVFDNGQSSQRQIPETTAGGVGILDYDGDGWFDLYVVQGGIFPPNPARPSTGDRLFRNRGDGTFDDVTASSGIGRLARGYGHGVAVGDFDNDGRPDLFLTRWRSYALFRNRGDGTFDDVTASAGLGGDRGWPTSAAFADLDNDGDLDLYVCHYLVWDEYMPALCVRTPRPGKPIDTERRYDYCVPDRFAALPDHLFRNDDGRFTDITSAAGIIDPNGRGLGVVAADLDLDGLVDLFVANDTSANYLWHNLGGMRFEEIATSSGVACNAAGAYQAGMGTAAGDLDGDGLPDLSVTNFYGESTTFFKNLGQGVFADRTAAIGLAGPSRYLLGFGIVYFDANNDGRLDLATTNGHVIDNRPDLPREMPGLLLAGGSDGRLADVTTSAGSCWTTNRLGRALAAGDLDNDGRVDLVVLPQNSPLAYFHNQTSGGDFLSLQLEGTTSNRDAVGATVTISAGGRIRKAWRLGGGSYQSASDPRIHLGLDQDRVDWVEVRWPSGQTDRFKHLEANRGYKLLEGSKSAPGLMLLMP